MPRKPLRSFSHWLIDLLRDAGVQDSPTNQIADHEDGASPTAARGPLKARLDALRLIAIRPGAWLTSSLLWLVGSLGPALYSMKPTPGRVT